MLQNKLEKKKKTRKILAVVFSVIIAFMLVLWAIQCINTNKVKITEKEEYYKTGEFVDIGNNFFITAREAADGYSIKVNSVELADYQALLEQYGGASELENYNDGYPSPKYTFLVNMTVKNEGNTEGALSVIAYSLCNQSLNIPADFSLWSLMDENYDGWPSIKLVENSEATLTIPFTPMSLDTGTNAKEVERRMENEAFDFAVSYFPTRKIIEVKADNK